MDSVTRSYFESFSGIAVPGKPIAPAPGTAIKEIPWVQWLQQTKIFPKKPTSLPAGAPGAYADESTWPIRQALALLAEQEPELYARRMQELTYLANVLIAGCSFQDRRFRPFEAAQASLAVCNLGWERLTRLPAGRRKSPAPNLSAHSLVAIFRVGWSLLFQEVSLRVGAKLEQALASKPKLTGKFKGKGWILRQLETLRLDLKKNLKAGKPWLIRNQLALLETLLDADASAALQAFLDECPSLSRSAASPAEPEFIHTLEQLKEIKQRTDAILAPGRAHTLASET